jgi:hypothetical protein
VTAPEAFFATPVMLPTAASWPFDVVNRVMSIVPWNACPAAVVPETGMFVMLVEWVPALDAGAPVALGKEFV